MKKANRFANMLLSRGIGKGDKVAILLMNGIEWLPIYFGILKNRRARRSDELPFLLR